MRTLRLSLAGTVILVLLGGLAGAVIAQDEGETAASPAYVSGTLAWLRDEGDVQSLYRADLDDPSVSGTFTLLDQVLDEYPGNVFVGRAQVELVNDEGRWSGEWSGGYHPTMGWQIMAWLVGEDAYEGLMFFMHAESDVFLASTLPMEGIVLEGVPPAWPPAD